jgi:FkbM family methyltransferase
MFSQSNEEVLIRDYFRGRPTGTFLDLGANDGVTLSNTRALYLAGWIGTLVDASPQAFAKLGKLYASAPLIELFNVAVFSDDGRVVFHESGTHFGKDDVALLSSIYPEETERWKASTQFSTTTVPCLKVSSLLEQSRYKTFNFITIDIEGADLMVLEQMDLTAMGCEMLIVEVNQNPVEPFTAHCTKHGLHYIGRNPENAIYQR